MAETESEYLSVDGGDTCVPVEKHSRSQSFALSNGAEFLSCLDEEEVQSQDGDWYELYPGHGVEGEEEERAEPAVASPAPQKSWLR